MCTLRHGPVESGGRHRRYVRVFCPNCGTQNEDSATACQKCGFNLKGAAAPKFKGTMLMVNAPPAVPRPGAPAAGTAAGSPSAKPAAPAAAKPVMKATMIGVAPPSPGAVAPPGPAPVPAAPAAAPGTSAMAATLGSPVAPPAPQPAPAPEAVNPLGGTMVAGPGGMMGYGGAPTPGGQAPAPSPAYAPTPAFSPAQAPIGSPSPMAGAQNALSATTPSGYAPGEFGAPAAPAPNPGWGAPAAPGPGMGSPYGGPVGGGPVGGYGGPQQPGGAPAMGGIPGAGGYSPYGAPAAMAPAPQAGYPMVGSVPHGPIGKMRNPVMVFVLTYVTCGIYGIIAMFSMLGELKAFRQKDDINPILFLLPIISILELIKLPAKVLEAKRMAGVPNAQEPNVILYFLLWIYFLPADLNEVWQAASARQGMGALPPGGI